MADVNGRDGGELVPFSVDGGPRGYAVVVEWMRTVAAHVRESGAHVLHVTAPDEGAAAFRAALGLGHELGASGLELDAFTFTALTVEPL